MSRNIDKANSNLVKFQEQQAGEHGGYKDYSRYKRPKRISSVTSLKEALQWRSQLVNEFQMARTRIFDPSLNEIQLREINDQLNDLVQEKKRWDWQINNKLSGKNMKPHKDNFFVGGKLILGKRYFGRAVGLPEIKDTIEEQKRKQQLSNPRQLVDLKRIPPINDKTNEQTQIYYNIHCSPTEQDDLSRFESHWTPVLQGLQAPKTEESTLSKITTPQVPTQEQMENWLVQQRKQKLLKQLDL